MQTPANGSQPPRMPTDKSALKDNLVDTVNKLIRRAKLMLGSGTGGEQYLKVKLSRFPIEAVVVCVIVLGANGFYIGEYFVAKSHNTDLETKVKTEWASVSSMKTDIESMAKVQKNTAPQTKSYEAAIKIIIKSGVTYSQIRPSDTGLTVDVKGSPDQIASLLSALKDEGIQTERSTLSFQTTTQPDGTVLNQVSSSITLSPKM